MTISQIRIIFTSFLLLITSLSLLYSQEIIKIPKKGSKGDFYIYYGWNTSIYGNSDISFSGEDYDFTLYDVVAKDRPSKYRANLYFNPKTFSVPQYNFRIGYFVTDRIIISFGVDHMKYVVTNGQYVNITGTTKNLNSVETFTFSNEPIIITEDFLQYEHTDGLNYIHSDIRLSHDLFAIGHLSFVSDIGGGIGFLLPKTNAQILGRARHDDFNIAGIGLNALVAIDIKFFDLIFLKTEVKGGHINMPNIRTTSESIDKASQSFWFSELTFVFGAKF